MKKLLPLVILLFILSAALAEPDDALPAFAWERNALEHWRSLPDGMQDRAAHILADGACTICGSEILIFEDGSADVSDYNAQGDLTRYTAFDADGVISLELCYAYDYDEAGRLLAAREFQADVLVSEVIYTTDTNGEPVPASYVLYYDDGSWTVDEYDLLGCLTHSAEYNAEGALAFETFCEYALSDGGKRYEALRLISYPDGGTRIIEYDEQNRVTRETECYDDASMTTEYNAQGDPIRITSYAADGTEEFTQTYEYEYAADMTMLISRAYMDGALLIQTEYAVSNGRSYACRETLYDDDGSSTVYEFSADEEILRALRYDPQGNVIP